MVKVLLPRLGESRLYPLVVRSEDTDAHANVKKFVREKYRCLITSYEAFCNFSLEFKSLENPLDILICDEGHRLKNPNTKQYKLLSALSVKKKVLITGTPIQNNLMELYACMNFVNPACFKNMKQFRTVYADPIAKGFLKNASYREKSTALSLSKELEANLMNFTIRRTQRILEEYLPKRHEFIIYLRPTEVQRAIYDKCLEDYKSSHLDKVGKSYTDTFSLFTCLRKVLTHPQLLVETEGETPLIQLNVEELYRRHKHLSEVSVKFAFIASLLSDLGPDNKTIIVSYYTTTLDRIADFLTNAMEIQYARLDGSNTAKQRELAIQTFSTSGSINVLLLGGKAGGTGLNIVAANRMIMMEVEWNPSNDAQVMGRIYRKGQTKEVFIYRLVAAGSVEEKIMQRQMIKRELGDQVIGSKKKEEKPEEEEAEVRPTGKGGKKVKEKDEPIEEEMQGFEPGANMSVEEFKFLFNKMGDTVGRFVQKRRNYKDEIVQRVPDCSDVGDLIEYVLIDEEKGLQIQPILPSESEETEDKTINYPELLAKEHNQQIREDWEDDSSNRLNQNLQSNKRLERSDSKKKKQVPLPQDTLLCHFRKVDLPTSFEEKQLSDTTGQTPPRETPKKLDQVTEPPPTPNRPETTEKFHMEADEALEALNDIF